MSRIVHVRGILAVILSRFFFHVWRMMLMIEVGYGRVDFEVHIDVYPAGVIDHTLFKIRIFNYRIRVAE